MIRRTGEGVWRVSEVTEKGAMPGTGPDDYRDYWRGTLLSPYPVLAMLLGAALTWGLSRGFPGAHLQNVRGSP